MSTDQKHEPETTALAEKLSQWWTRFKQGKLISYRVMALLLIAVTALGGYLYFLSAKVVEVSKTWFELETKNSLSSLKDFSKSFPDTPAGRVAELHAARFQLGPDGVDKLADARDEAARKKAVANVEEARDALDRLAGVFKDDPVLRVECLLGLAKAEAALVGLTKENSLDFRGSTAVLADRLDKVAEAAAGTPWGEDAKKLADTLRAPGGAVAAEFQRVQIGLYKLDPVAAPDGGPLAPTGASPFGALPGLPGGLSGFGGGPLPAGPFTPAPPGGVAIPIPPAVTPPVVPLAPSGPTPPNPTPPGPTPPGPKAPDPTPPAPVPPKP